MILMFSTRLVMDVILLAQFVATNAIEDQQSMRRVAGVSAEFMRISPAYRRGVDDAEGGQALAGTSAGQSFIFFIFSVLSALIMAFQKKSSMPLRT